MVNVYSIHKMRNWLNYWGKSEQQKIQHGLTCGSLRRIPDVWINSHPRIRRSVSMSISSPSWTERLGESFSLGISTFSRVRITLEKSLLDNVFSSFTLAILNVECMVKIVPENLCSCTDKKILVRSTFIT